MVNSTKIRFLIAEDNPSFQEIYQEILSDEFDVEYAKDIETALKVLKDFEPDIALLDMRLVKDQRGNIDGLIIAQEIRDLGYQTIIILASGFPREKQEIRDKLNALNIFEIIDKSADQSVEKLINIITDATERIHIRRQGAIK